MPEQTPAVPPLLSPDQALDLQQRALHAARNAYAPYSHFHVGAALLLAAPHAGTIITGCNVENSSYRLCTCAEQTAVAAAVAQLGPSIQLLAVAVANQNRAPSAPCGACRQTLLEFSPDPTRVLILYPGSAPDGSIVDQQCTLADLLPSAFLLKASPLSIT